MPVDADNTTSLAAGDMDGDGDLDLVVGNFLRTPYGQRNSLYLNDGSATLTDATATRLPVVADDTRSVVLGDVDGDGDADLLIGNHGAGGQQNRLYLNTGADGFTDATATRMPVIADETMAQVIGDVDGDGDLDLVVGNGWQFGQQNRLYLNNGAGTFTDATGAGLPGISDRTWSLALGDVDGDGDLDLVLGNLNHQNRLYLNDGTGRFTDATTTHLPVIVDPTTAVALGDVDGDGDLDLVVGNARGGGGQTRLCLNDGAGRFTEVTATRMPVANYSDGSLALGDVDEDGDLDIVVGITPYLAQQNRLYLNDGNGTFSDATATRMPTDNENSTAVALGDVDGDGDLDLVVGNNGDASFRGNQSRLYLNLLRQLDAPFVLHAGSTYRLDVYARYGPARQTDLAMVFLSLATANIPLPPLGTVGIDPNLMVGLPSFTVPQPAGVGSLTVMVPNTPSLAGIAIHSQALLIQNPLQARLTNVNTDITLR